MKWGFSNKMKILQGKVSHAFPKALTCHTWQDLLGKCS